MVNPQVNLEVSDPKSISCFPSSRTEPSQVGAQPAEQYYSSLKFIKFKNHLDDKDTRELSPASHLCSNTTDSETTSQMTSRIRCILQALDKHMKSTHPVAISSEDLHKRIGQANSNK